MELRIVFLAAACFACSWANNMTWLATTTILGAAGEWGTCDETMTVCKTATAWETVTLIVVETASTNPTGHYPRTTSISLANAVLTNVTVQTASSPTSCYRLPTPIASLHAVGFGASFRSDPPMNIDDVFFYLADNATALVYVATSIGNDQILLDISASSFAAGRVGLVLPRGESIVFDERGIHHFNASCDSVLSIDIGGFLDQVTSIAHYSTQSRRNLYLRETNSTFFVTLHIDDLVGNQLLEPQLSFGPTGCTLVTQQLGTEWSNFTWMCDFPGANSSAEKCSDSFSSWLLPSSLPSEAKSDLFNNETLFNVLPRFLNEARDSIISLFPNMNQPLGDGLNWITSAHGAVLEAGAGRGDVLCSHLHQDAQYTLLFSDPGLSSTYTVGVYNSPPAPTIVGQIALRTTLMTAAPPRVVVPTISYFPSVTATSF